MARLEHNSRPEREAAVSPGAAAAELPERGAIAAAVQAFLAGRALPAAYVETRVGGYRALCHAPAAGGDPAHLSLLLLATEDGAAYVLDAADAPAIAAAEVALRANRYRPAGGTLALRLPADCGGGTGTFHLWASPKYLAGASQVETLWK